MGDDTDGADFERYATDGTGSCPTTSEFGYRSWTPNSRETVTIDAPDDATALRLLADAYADSGSFEVAITEYQ
ncbi:hypothetical protein [Candidatus Halobonum tyrrellensis]|uniref:Subtilisin-like serine protease n=1 Tax=Candidatus Halobonum tyrrellensis G22 TaxID=1324957 RepID=V4J0L3_9EURY|nr:hypothetical protein [Candidatus Halobonum tyrrellensis]ESP89007.1 subtilisin-like serine protease [Candidatus Halobonum tyrrellensis G22]